METRIISALGDVYGLPTQVRAFGNGHINDTFVTEGEPRYVVQRINHKVFTDPVGVMNNFEAVTDYLRVRLRQTGGDAERETLTLLHTKDGKNHAVIDGNYYRVYRLVENAFAYEVLETAEQFEAGARAFGKFQRLLKDFPAERLVETIPQFHDTPNRYRQLEEAVARNAAGRLSEVGEELAFVRARKESLGVITDALRDGSIPLRVTHNDTKINNVLFDKSTGKGLCVIDLDTVMPGSMLFDFGDAIRAGATTAAEDERDLDLVHFRLDFYRAFRRGFLAELGDSVTPREKELLPEAARLLTLECGMRFLADHLNGDVYFRVHREGHNLDRARTQFKLVREMEEMDAQMRE